MAQRVEALVHPDLLVWARETAGLDAEVAAKKAGVKPERIAEWEAGQRRPTIKQLRALAWIYRRPIAVFYLPEVPEAEEMPKDFRRLPGQVAGVESSDLRFEIRKAGLRREIALELSGLEGEEPEGIEASASLDESPEEVGARVRDLLGVHLTDQVGWRGPYDSFNGWRGAVEGAGALVFQMTAVELSEARGFSISESPLPTVVVNVKDSPRGRAFSLLHEFGHLMLRDGGLCDLDDVTERPPGELRVERFCNSVAGSALVPSEALFADQTVRAHPGGEVAWSDTELAAIAGRFGVSREVVLRRLLDFGRTNSDFYAQKRIEFLETYERLRQGRQGGFAPPAQMAFASAGPSFTGLVLSSYSEGRITASDVSDYLDVRLKHLPRIQQQLLGSAS